MGTTYTYRAYDEDGKYVGGNQGFLPSYLDWMPIEAKVFWFKYIGMGPDTTKYALFESQGEQKLIRDISLKNLTYKQYKEISDGAERHVQEFIDSEGISRTPRNQ